METKKYRCTARCMAEMVRVDYQTINTLVLKNNLVTLIRQTRIGNTTIQVGIAEYWLPTEQFERCFEKVEV